MNTTIQWKLTSKIPTTLWSGKKINNINQPKNIQSKPIHAASCIKKIINETIHVGGINTIEKVKTAWCELQDASKIS